MMFTLKGTVGFHFYTVLQLSVAGHEFIGKADLPQMAKHHAAEQAMPVLSQGRRHHSVLS